MKNFGYLIIGVVFSLSNVTLSLAAERGAQDPYEAALSILAPKGYERVKGSTSESSETISHHVKNILKDYNADAPDLGYVSTQALYGASNSTPLGKERHKVDYDYWQKLNITNTRATSEQIKQREAAATALKKLLEHILLTEKKGVTSEEAGRVARLLYNVLPHQEAKAFIEQVKSKIPADGNGQGRPVHGL